MILHVSHDKPRKSQLSVTERILTSNFLKFETSVNEREELKVNFNVN